MEYIILYNANGEDESGVMDVEANSPENALIKFRQVIGNEVTINSIEEN